MARNDTYTVRILDVKMIRKLKKNTKRKNGPSVQEQVNEALRKCYGGDEK